MALKKRQILLAAPDHYALPADLRFVGLIPSAGTETIQIRFSRDYATVLDFPLSAETLVDLIHALVPLYGDTRERVLEELEILRQRGGLPKE